MGPIVATMAVVAWGCASVFTLHPGGRGRLLQALAFGPGVGFGLLSLVVFFSRVLGLARPTLWTIAGVGAIVWGLVRLSRPARAAREATPDARDRRWPGWLRWAAAVLCAGTLVVALAGFYVFSVRQPDGAWDAVAMWNVRARFLFAGYDAFPDSQRRVAPMSMPYRPLLLPGAVAGQAMLVGSEDQTIGSATALAFTAALGTLVFFLVRSAASATVALVAVALTFSARPLVHWAPSQMADVPLAYYLLASAAGLASLQRSAGVPRLHPALIGFMLGMLLWIKDEGSALAAILILAGCVFALLDGVPRDTAWRRSPLLPLAVGAVPGAVALLIYRGPGIEAIGLLQGDWVGRLLSPERWWLSVREVSSMLFGWAWGDDRGWGLTWAFVQGSAILGLWYRSKASTRLLCQVTVVMLLICAFWILTYTLTPWAQEWHIGSSLERAVAQVYPTVVVATLLALHHSKAFAPSSG